MDAFDPSLLTIILLIAAAFLAGYIDTLVGGGGLITIPALMAAGMPPIVALGTNKLQAVAGSGTATITLLMRSKVSFRDVRWLMLTAFLGSIVGAVLVQYLDTDVLNVVIPIVIIVIALYFIFSAQHSINERPPLLSTQTYGMSAAPVIGFYDGMFGPGTGSFFVWSGVALRGQAIVQSTIVAKTLNFATNMAGLMVFVMFGKVAWMVGICMMIGQSFGARLGTHYLVSVNPALLRYFVIAVCGIILFAWVLRS